MTDRIEEIKARRAAITSINGETHWQWQALQIDLTVRDGKQAGLFAYKPDFSAGVEVIGAYCDGHAPEDESVPNPIQIKDADAWFIEHAPSDIDYLLTRCAELLQWVDDLQSGMYVNCVYCGHRYGPGETTPVSMADALKAHIEQCPEHPASKLKAEVERLQRENEILKNKEARLLDMLHSVPPGEAPDRQELP